MSVQTVCDICGHVVAPLEMTLAVTRSDSRGTWSRSDLPNAGKTLDWCQACSTEVMVTVKTMRAQLTTGPAATAKPFLH